MQELLLWCEESANFWKTSLEAHPALLALPCGIGGAADVQALVRHIWGVELLWSQRIAGLPVQDKNDWPVAPLDALFALHLEAMQTYRSLLERPEVQWDERIDLDRPGLPPQARNPTRRKMLGHALLHGQRHWAQLATLTRQAGYPSVGYQDYLFYKVGK